MGVRYHTAHAGKPAPGSWHDGSAIPFRDITAGDNRFPAMAGYDLVTGRGSWDG